MHASAKCSSFADGMDAFPRKPVIEILTQRYTTSNWRSPECAKVTTGCQFFEALEFVCEPHQDWIFGQGGQIGWSSDF